jgi:hypothetical protein
VNSDGIEELVVSGRWNEVDTRNAIHLGTPIYLGGAGMEDDHGDEIAQRALVMTDMGFDPLRQMNDLAIVNELFTPWGQLRSLGVGSYNLGVKIGGGLRSIDDLLQDGVDAAVAVQEETRAAAGIQLDSPFARAIGPQIERMSPGARLALEVAGDALFFVPMAAEFRGMTSEISAFNRPLFEFSPSSSGPRQFANQIGAVGDLEASFTEQLSRGAQLRAKYGHLSPEQRAARIDLLSRLNYERRLAEAIYDQDYIFRYLSEEGLDRALRSGTIRGYGTTEFSHSGSTVARSSQIMPAWGEPAYGVAIPVDSLRGFGVARPFGNSATRGWEIYTNSYPAAGSGGWSQFLLDPIPINETYIFRLSR